MQKAFTVAQVTSYIRNMFAQDFVLSSVKVTGEISNCKYHSAGHIYFTLKDAKSSIACVMFASDRQHLKFVLEDGQKVEIDGRIDVYEKSGSYQLYAKKIKQSGEGELYEKYLELKNELESMGMFSDEYKRPIPKYIKRLGVVTAPNGAAVRDIIQITRRRNPGVQIILFPAQVQGEGAAASVANGIRGLQNQNVDVIIVGRGGGSIEDLWAFNEREVAEAIFDSEIPIISAVGHETDFTIADFVSDLRAPTPSAAAELAVYESARLEKELKNYEDILLSAMYEKIKTARKEVNDKRTKLAYLSPENRIRQNRMRVISTEEKLGFLMRRCLDRKKHEFEIRINTLKGLSPLDKLNQGYSVALTADNTKIKSVNDVQCGELISLYVSDGKVSARVEETNGNT